MINLPKISFGLRLFLFFFLLIGLGFSLQLKVMQDELRPGLRQATEETLVDAANLLAEMVAPEFINAQIDFAHFNRSFQAFKDREFKAVIWSKSKVQGSLKAYITDAQGVVVYHSEGRDIGANYYQWNDVHQTLKGHYGARSTEAVEGDSFSTEIHVAAPIMADNQIIGVLTLIKSNRSLQPFLDNAQSRVQNFSYGLIILAIFMGFILSYWLTRSIKKLNRYVTKVSQGQGAVLLPTFRDTELNNLAQAMDTMRQKLEGKDYVEKYIHSLTHELKSPVAAIKGAAEILVDKLPEKDRLHFLQNIHNETVRLESIITQLLELATLENRKGPGHIESVEVGALINELLPSWQHHLKAKQITLTVRGTAEMEAERCLLSYALGNLLQNALEFSPEKSTVQVSIANHNGEVVIQIEDEGPGIPAYALNMVFDRFYSLPRPNCGRKSSGLGLSFVRQICYLHRADCQLTNRDDGQSGAIARLIWPSVQSQ